MSSEDKPKVGSADAPAPSAGDSPSRNPDDPNVPDWASKSHPSLPEAARGETGTPVPEAPPPAAAEAPAKAAPPPKKPAAGKAVERREFLNWLALGWIAFSAASAAGLTALGRFFFPNVLFEPPSIFKVGYPEDFAEGMVDLRFKEKFRVWVVREGGQIYALYAKCTHLGCTPNWLAAENKFKCPCHGSGFYKSGINFEGPAPRPLERVKISLADDGQIRLDKDIVFQQEKGQWNDPASFLTV